MLVIGGIRVSFYRNGGENPEIHNIKFVQLISNDIKNIHKFVLQVNILFTCNLNNVSGKKFFY